MSDQLGEGGKSVVELGKLKKRLEMEKEELQTAVEVRDIDQIFSYTNLKISRQLAFHENYLTCKITQTDLYVHISIFRKPRVP